MKHQKLLYLLSFGVILAIVSCNSQQKKNSAEEGFRFSDEKQVANVELTKSFIYAFPSPGDLLDRVSEAGLEYHEALMNPPSFAENYLTSRDQSLNLGIYVTDLAYSAMFSRSTVAVEYLDAVKSLSNKVHISSGSFGSLIDRARDNIGNTDSLLELSNEVFYQMVEYLENNGEGNTIALISAGAYVEAMYLAMKTAEDQLDEVEILQQVAELKYPLKNLLDHAEGLSEDPNVQSILNYIRELDKIFSELEQEVGANKVSHKEPGVISLGGGSVESIDMEEFKALRIKVYEVRNSIIKN